MRQKYRKLTFVRVAAEMPPHMAHFPAGFDAIVKETYSQLYGGTDLDSYSLYKIEDGKVVDCISWYKEYQLTAWARQDPTKAEEMLENYELYDSQVKLTQPRSEETEKMKMRMTPNHIKVLIHCHIVGTPHPRAPAPAVQQALSDLEALGLIGAVFPTGHPAPVKYKTTGRGKAHVKQICEIALPIVTWTDQEGKVL